MTSDELLRQIDNKVEQKLQNIAEHLLMQKNMEEYKAMQEQAKTDFIGTGLEQQAIDMSKRDYSDSNYYELKGFISAKKHLYRKKKDGVEQKPFGAYNSGGMENQYKKQNKSLPIDLTEIIESCNNDIDSFVQNNDPDFTFHNGCYIYKTKPHDFAKYFSHNRQQIMEEENSPSARAMLEEFRSAVDKALERDEINGYLNTLSIA